jgi:hypothetical protein
LSIGVATLDPRIFLTSSPAPAVVSGGKAVSDFAAYVGSNINDSQATLLSNSDKGAYSFSNYNRYYLSITGANCEPFIFIGYPEMCLNIAEGINRGWVTGASAATWYKNGINASLASYGLTDGQSVSINFPVKSTVSSVNPSGIAQGSVWGNVTINTSQFLTQVTYAGDNAAGLTQILTQKYMAMFNNSGWEAYYNYRRTGVPALLQGGAGIGTINNLLPRRWLYPSSEMTYNSDNYQSALSSQFGGSDDLGKDTWLTK